MTYTKEELIEYLGLIPHPEGGYFREIYLSDVDISKYKSLSVIYFLLDENNFSAFHKIKFDELWSFNYGSPLTIVEIDNQSNIKETTLGDILNPNTFFYKVKGNNIFASYVKTGFSLVSCYVTPSFSYEDFYLYKRCELLKLYPEFETFINKLTRE